LRPNVAASGGAAGARLGRLATGGRSGAGAPAGGEPALGGAADSPGAGGGSRRAPGGSGEPSPSGRPADPTVGTSTARFWGVGPVSTGRTTERCTGGLADGDGVTAGAGPSGDRVGGPVAVDASPGSEPAAVGEGGEDPARSGRLVSPALGSAGRTGRSGGRSALSMDRWAGRGASPGAGTGRSASCGRLAGSGGLAVRNGRASGGAAVAGASSGGAWGGPGAGAAAGASEAGCAWLAVSRGWS
jgi:hypothetical protein